MLDIELNWMNISISWKRWKNKKEKIKDINKKRKKKDKLSCDFYRNKETNKYLFI